MGDRSLRRALDQQVKHFNGLTPAQAERLALLLEEMGEAQQAIGKILRHGYDSQDPDMRPGAVPDNRAALERELGDVTCSLAMLTASGDLDKEKIFARSEKKTILVRDYLHHQMPAKTS